MKRNYRAEITKRAAEYTPGEGWKFSVDDMVKTLAVFQLMDYAIKIIEQCPRLESTVQGLGNEQFGITERMWEDITEEEEVKVQARFSKTWVAKLVVPKLNPSEELKNLELAQKSLLNVKKFALRLGEYNTDAPEAMTSSGLDIDEYLDYIKHIVEEAKQNRETTGMHDKEYYDREGGKFNEYNKRHPQLTDPTDFDDQSYDCPKCGEDYQDCKCGDSNYPTIKETF